MRFWCEGGSIEHAAEPGLKFSFAFLLVAKGCDGEKHEQ